MKQTLNAISSKKFTPPRLLRGDCCLPNIPLDGFRLSGFIDLVSAAEAFG